MSQPVINRLLADLAALRAHQRGGVRVTAVSICKSKRDALIKDTAKEFMAVIGKSASVKVAGDGDKKEEAKTDETAIISGFIEKVQKHFAVSKSKGKAMSLAIAEDGKGYEIWRDTGKAPNYTKTA